MEAFLVKLALLFVVRPSVSQSEDDVSLADSYTTTFMNVGRLEIYFNDRWGTFVGCLQEEPKQRVGRWGSVIYDSWYITSKKVPLAEPDTPHYDFKYFCGYSGKDDVNHVLRCGYSTDVPSSCNHTTDIVLCCTKYSIWKYPYEMDAVEY